MSYQVLARKWRPQNFKEMVGQQHVLRALINALEEQRLHHAYLFTGTRGVGKTTIARILVKCLNCETGITAEPCGECSSCREIAEGRFVDLIEVDAASRTKVEDTRELLENVHYAPTRGRFKVYLIDEVHMLSGHSFNALLKTLEEPPEHVKFLFATTDPQKLPATILSRCLQFNLKRMPMDLIRGHLQNILEKESIAFDESAIKQLGRAADGSMRDALSLMDQAIAFGAGELKAAEVKDMLGTISHDWLSALIHAVADSEGKKLLNIVEDMAGQVSDFEAAADGLISMLHQLAILQIVPESEADEEYLEPLAAKLSMNDVQLFYQIALNGRRDIPLSPDPRSGFEMLLLRMMAFSPVSAADSTTVDSTTSELAKKKLSHLGKEYHEEQKKGAVSESAEVSNESKSTSVAELPKQSVVDNNELPPFDIGVVFEPSPSSVSVEEVKSVALVEPESVAAMTIEPDIKPVIPSSVESVGNNNEWDWHKILAELGLTGMTAQFANHCLLEKFEAGTLFLLLDKKGEQLHSVGTELELKRNLEVFFNKPVKLAIQAVNVSAETPAQRYDRRSEEEQVGIETMIEEDPFVLALQSKLGAQIVPGSIKKKSKKS